MLHWHGDTFDLPAGAALLASTAICPNQAFSSRSRTLAIQFHPEVTAAGLERWFIGHACEIDNTRGVEVETLRAQSARHTDELERCGRLMLEEWLCAAFGSGTD